MQRQPRLTKRERRELDRPNSERLLRPRTLTRMTTPAQPKPLPAGWIKCPQCREPLQVSALFVLHLIQPELTTNDADEVIPNPEVGKIEIAGHFCPSCMQPIWPPDDPNEKG